MVYFLQNVDIRKFDLGYDENEKDNYVYGFGEWKEDPMKGEVGGFNGKMAQILTRLEGDRWADIRVLAGVCIRGVLPPDISPDKADGVHGDTH